MPNAEALRLKVRNIYITFTHKQRRKQLLDENFTVISNNCWGGFIYQSYGLKYNTPTVGLFFMADDYIKFITNLEYYINARLQFIEPYKSRHYNFLKMDSRFGTYPIGVLDDIEIMFLHYKSPEEAAEKWTRRCERINWNRILIKFNDQNECKDEQIEKFDKLSFKSKICFTSKPYPKLKTTVFIKSARKQSYVFAGQEPVGKSKYLDITALLNNL